jgi:hypothetical protein
VLYADTHVRFSSFTGKWLTTDGYRYPCWEDWGFEHNWEGYYE